MKRTNVTADRLVAAAVMGGGLVCAPMQHLAAWGQPAQPVAAPVKTPLNAPLPAAAPFADEINAFQKADKKAMPPQGAVLFIGSSSIRLWETLPQDLAEVPVVNRGFGGSQIADSTRYFDRIVAPYAPKLIVFYAGGNDLNAGKTPPQVLEDFRVFVAKVHAHLPTTRVAYVSINPSTARWKEEPQILETNRLIAEFVQQPGVDTVPLSFLDSHALLLGADGQPQGKLLREDGLHLNAEGYKAWASILKLQILELAAEQGVIRLDDGDAENKDEKKDEAVEDGAGQ